MDPHKYSILNLWNRWASSLKTIKLYWLWFFVINEKTIFIYILNCLIWAKVYFDNFRELINFSMMWCHSIRYWLWCDVTVFVTDCDVMSQYITSVTEIKFWFPLLIVMWCHSMHYWSWCNVTVCITDRIVMSQHHGIMHDKCHYMLFLPKFYVIRGIMHDKWQHMPFCPTAFWPCSY